MRLPAFCDPVFLVAAAQSDGRHAARLTLRPDASGGIAGIAEHQRLHRVWAGEIVYRAMVCMTPQQGSDRTAGVRLRSEWHFMTAEARSAPDCSAR